MPTDTIQAAWHSRAEALADWALPLFFARTDRYGGYYVKDGEVRKCARPDRATADVVHRGRVLAHFRATRTDHVIGPYSLGAEPRCVGRVASADIDAHAAGDDPERNRRYALHLYHNLVLDGFRPLLATWGAGSFHLHALFDRDVAGDALFRFGRWLVADAPEFGFAQPVESYPKQAAVPAGKYGNWLRLVGRHHTRDAWASVFDGTTWLDGDAAAAHVLTLTGDSPDLIPEAARTFDPAAGTRAPVRAADPRPHDPDRGDLFGEFNAAQTMHSVAALLQRNGWAAAGRRGERWDFRRPGKGDDKSGNLMAVGGVPLFYGFTTNGGITSEKGLTPTRLRAELEFAGDFARLALALRAEGYGAPIPVRELPAPPATPAEPPPPKEGGLTPPAPPAPEPRVATDPDAPRTAAAIIRDHFRATYRPDFRRGNAVHCADGELVAQAVATSTPNSRLIAALADAVDAPRDKHANVIHAKLPGFFATWAKVAWGDLLAELPDEDRADLDPGAEAGEQFRALVRDAMLSLLVLARELQVGRGAVEHQQERRSLIDWCEKFAKPGPWRSIRSYKCWSRSRAAGRELVLEVAVRHELFGQLGGDRRLRDLTYNAFARRCERYGVGASSHDERPEGRRAVVLAPAFVAELLGGRPADDGSEDGSLFCRDPEKTKMRAG